MMSDLVIDTKRSPGGWFVIGDWFGKE